MLGQKCRSVAQLVAGACFGITLMVCDGAGPPDSNAAPDGGMGDDMMPPGMGTGGVPHYIDADTGEDLGVVLVFAQGNSWPVAFSGKLNAPLLLNTSRTLLVYPFADCKGPLMVSVDDSLAGKRNPFQSPSLIAPTFYLGPDGTYLRLAGKAAIADVTSHYEMKFGSMVCVNGPRTYVDEFTDTKVPGKENYKNLKIELR